MRIIFNNKILERSHLGLLFIGIENDGNIFGLEKDYKTLSKDKQNRDGFLLHLIEIIKKHIGLEYKDFFEIYLTDFQGQDVCLIKVFDSNEPIFIFKNNEPFFIIHAQTRT